MIKAAIEEILKAGFTVIEHPNNSNDGKTNHLTIIGGKRKVDLWPTTGTIFAPKDDKYPNYRLRNASVKVAITLAKQGRL